MVETAALAFVYAIVVECFVTRDLHVFRTLPTALVKSSVLAGAVLILLSAAMGITSYIVDAQIPDTLVTWVKTHIESRWVFLLALNGAADRRGLPGRHLLGDRGARPAPRADGGGLRRPPHPPRRHLPRRTWSSAT